MAKRNRKDNKREFIVSAGDELNMNFEFSAVDNDAAVKIVQNKLGQAFRKLAGESPKFVSRRQLEEYKQYIKSTILKVEFESVLKVLLDRISSFYHNSGTTDPAEKRLRLLDYIYKLTNDDELLDKFHNDRFNQYKSLNNASKEDVIHIPLPMGIQPTLTRLGFLESDIVVTDKIILDSTVIDISYTSRINCRGSESIISKMEENLFDYMDSEEYFSLATPSYGVSPSKIKKISINVYTNRTGEESYSDIVVGIKNVKTIRLIDRDDESNKFKALLQFHLSNINKGEYLKFDVK